MESANVNNRATLIETAKHLRKTRLSTRKTLKMEITTKELQLTKKVTTKQNQIILSSLNFLLKAKKKKKTKTKTIKQNLQHAPELNNYHNILDLQKKTKRKN